MAITLNGDTGIVTPGMTAAGVPFPVEGGFAHRNRIINGDMRIDQRNAGASVTSENNYVFGVDRFRVGYGVGGQITAQQSTTVPSGYGFQNSLILTVAATDASPASGDLYALIQAIEGVNVADLMWGTASAKTITISFWVRSSITGTYTVTFSNSAFDRSYPATYTIASANVWQQVSITVAGDTSGTWLKNNGVGIYVLFGLGGGATYLTGTANAWNAAGGLQTSSQTAWIANSSATFYITGVQLEVGSVATEFERRPYGTELSLCQRYYSRLKGDGATTYVGFGAGGVDISTSMAVYIKYPVSMRAAPTFTQSNTAVYVGGAVKAVSSINSTQPGTDAAYIVVGGFTGATVGNGGVWLGNGTTAAYVELSAEL